MLFQPGNGNLKVIKLNGMDCGPEGKPGGSAGQKDLNEHKNRYQEPTEAEVDQETEQRSQPGWRQGQGKGRRGQTWAIRGRR